MFLKTFTFTFDTNGAFFQPPIDCRRVKMRDIAGVNEYDIMAPESTDAAYHCNAGEEFDTNQISPPNRIIFGNKNLAFFKASSGSITMKGIAIL